MSVSTVNDILTSLARTDVSTSTIRQIVQEQSAVAQLVAPIPMPTTVMGATIVAEPTVAAKAYTGATTFQEPSLTPKVMTAYPLTAVLVFGRWADVDAEAFNEQLNAKLGSAFAKAIDAQILRDPQSVFGTSVITVASGCSNFYQTTTGTNYALYDDLNSTVGLVEANDVFVSGIIGRRGDLAAVRGAKDSNGNPVFASAVNGAPATLLGYPFYNVATQALPKTATPGEKRFIVGKWDEILWGIHTRLTIDLVTEGDVSDGSTTYKLTSNDQIAVVARLRMGFVINNGCAFAYLYE